MRYKVPFQRFKKKLKSGTKVYYYTIYDNLNRRRQYSTGCKTKKGGSYQCYEVGGSEAIPQELKESIKQDLLFSNGK